MMMDNSNNYNRYLVLYLLGGVYADVDVEPIKKIDQWLPHGLNITGKLIVGFEGNCETEERRKQDNGCNFPAIRPFQQYTLYSAPKHEIVHNAIETIQRTHPAPHFRYTKGTGNEKDDIGWATGPGLWTKLVQHYITKRGYTIKYVFEYIHRQRDTSKRLFVLDDLIVLSVDAFRHGGQIIQPETPKDIISVKSDQLILHHFHGSWIKDSKRYHKQDVPLHD